mmetsp:Transcript_21449/g.55211  ORF Transcript_21449/g.55211 Transcript_21449/m.55211 type:complete len:190 (+) Transcript_21449:45-614(+)
MPMDEGGPPARSVSKRVVLGAACAALGVFVVLTAMAALVAEADEVPSAIHRHKRSKTPAHSSIFPEVPPPDPWSISRYNNQSVWKPPSTCKPCMENKCHPHMEGKCAAQRGFLDPWYIELDQCMCSCCNTQVSCLARGRRRHPSCGALPRMALTPSYLRACARHTLRLCFSAACPMATTRATGKRGCAP